MKGFVINLKHETEKLSRFKQHSHFEEVFQVFEAIDGTQQKLDLKDVEDRFDYYKAYKVGNRPLTMSEICCAISHNSVLQLIANDPEIEDDDFALICEDDIEFIDDWYKKIKLIRDLVRNIPEIYVVSFQNPWINNFEKFNIDKSSAEDELGIENKAKVFTINKDLQLYALSQMHEVYGGACYMIRKSYSKKTAFKKQHFIADDWQLRVGERHILRTNPVLAYAKIEESNLQTLRDIHFHIGRKNNRLSDKIDNFYTNILRKKMFKKLVANITNYQIQDKIDNHTIDIKKEIFEYEKINQKIQFSETIDFKQSFINNVAAAILIETPTDQLDSSTDSLLTDLDFSIYKTFDGSQIPFVRFGLWFKFHNCFRKLRRSFTPLEITTTLNHHNIHKIIANNLTIQDDDFVLIAQPNIQFKKIAGGKKWQETVEKIAAKLKPVKSVNLVNLVYQGDIALENTLDRFTIDGIDAVVLKSLEYNLGSSLYLIRKSACIKLNKQKKLTNLISFWNEQLDLSSIIYLAQPIGTETKVIDCFEKLKWQYNRVAYYNPPKSQKIKESIARKFFKLKYGKRFK